MMKLASMLAKLGKYSTKRNLPVDVVTIHDGKFEYAEGGGDVLQIVNIKHSPDKSRILIYVKPSY